MMTQHFSFILTVPTRALFCSNYYAVVHLHRDSVDGLYQGPYFRKLEVPISIFVRE